MTNDDGIVIIVRISPDIENEGKLTSGTKLQLFHFQSSARSAKKSLYIFG